MNANPYAAVLAGRDAQEILDETPSRWRVVMSSHARDERERTPASGKWNLRQVICHMADCELAFGFRMRQVAGNAPTIQPFDQDAWAKSYAAYSTELAFATFLALRAWNVAFVGSLSEDAKVHTAIHPERGAISLWTVVETLAGHDLHHLNILEA